MKLKIKKVVRLTKIALKEIALAVCLVVFVSGLGSAYKLAVAAMEAPFVYTLDSPAKYGQFARDKAGSLAKVTRSMGTRTGGGSAFITTAASGRRVLISNAHVCSIGKADMYMDVTFDDGSRTLPARILEILPQIDICIMEAPAGHEGLPLGDPVQNGDPVMVMGHPKLHPLTLEAGHVAQAHGTIEMYADLGEAECKKVGGKYGPIPSIWFTLITCSVTYDTDYIFVRIFPGNSGSAVVNTKGEIVGVVFASQNDQSMGYMVSVEHLRHALLAY